MLCASSSAVTAKRPQPPPPAEAAPPPAASAAPPSQPRSGRAFLCRAAGGLLASGLGCFSLSGSAASCSCSLLLLFVVCFCFFPCSIHRNLEAKSRNGRSLRDRHGERCLRGRRVGELQAVPSFGGSFLSVGRALKAAPKISRSGFTPAMLRSVALLGPGGSAQLRACGFLLCALLSGGSSYTFHVLFMCSVCVCLLSPPWFIPQLRYCAL